MWWQTVRVGIFALVGLLVTSLVATPANAAGDFVGRWSGSYAYVYWADSCDYESRDFPWWSMNINFSGGPRPGGKTYIYDMVIANGGASEIYFPNGLTLGNSGVYRSYWPGRIAHGGSQRFIVNTEFPARRVIASFFPVADSHPCDWTRAAVEY